MDHLPCLTAASHSIGRYAVLPTLLFPPFKCLIFPFDSVLACYHCTQRGERKRKMPPIPRNLLPFLPFIPRYSRLLHYASGNIVWGRGGCVCVTEGWSIVSRGRGTETCGRNGNQCMRVNPLEDLLQIVLVDHLLTSLFFFTAVDD